MNDNNRNEEYELIRERIKTRPINRKKLFRRTVITAAMAVIFGVLACITFLVLEPVFSEMLSRKNKPVADEITIPLDEEETMPGDLILEDKTEPQTQIIIKETGSESTALETYIETYNEIYAMYRNCQKSIVTVAGVNKDVDLFNNSYRSQNISTGLIVANNGVELLILTDSNAIKNSETIEVTFFNELVAEGVIKETDKNTGLAIVAINVENLTDTVLDPAIIASLGTSKTSRLIATPVVAIGRPMGNTVESIEMGFVTSERNVLNMVDNNYELFSTDMNGNTTSNGVIFNLNGEVVGIIFQRNGLFAQSTISAIGISDLKKTIERMSNGKERAVLGIRGTDVTAEAMSQGVPSGVYVSEIEMGSPAMKAGIQGGDVITKIDGFEITSFTVYTEAISLRNPGDEAQIAIQRPSVDGYVELEISVVLGE